MHPPSVTTDHRFPIPESMQAWVLGDPGQLIPTRKPVPMPGRSEVMVRIDAVAICATDLDNIYYGPPALIQGGLPFNKNWTPGHEYMGTVVALGPAVDEFTIGERVACEIHAGCGQCKRCREGMYTSCHNYGMNYGAHDKGHRANGFTTDGGFCEYQVNHINTLVRIADDMPDDRLAIARRLGADHVVNVRNIDAVQAVHKLNGGIGVDYAVECSAAPDAVSTAVHMVNRGGKVCLAAFQHEPVKVDIAHVVKNNIYLYGIRGEGRSATRRAEALMRQKRFDAGLIHTHTFALEDLPTAISYAKNHTDNAIKVVVKARGVAKV